MRLAVCVVAAGLCAGLGGVVSAQTQTQSQMHTVTQAQTQMQGSGGGTKTMLMEPPAPLLPATLGKMKRAAEGDVGDGLGAVDAADAAAMTEDGLRRFARSEYADGPRQGTVTVYKFMDASGAVAAYDYLRRPGMRTEKVGDDAVSNGDELLMRSGVNVVVGHFRLEHEAMIALTRELIAGLPKVNGSAGIAPMLPGLVPGKVGTDAESVRYALGPRGYTTMGGVLPAQMVGFDKNAEVVTARTKDGGALTLLMYPTPEIAGDHERAIEALRRQQSSVLTGTVKIRREGPLLLLTTGAWTADEAEKMVDGIHLRSEVTWDKPVPLDFGTEVRKTFSLLENIAIFCAISALAMLVLGLFLGYGRALVRVMQGKPAASEPEFLRIDLSGAVGKKLRDPTE
jgi:hypothetical protein